jgi:hypothetical protein
MPSKQLSQPEVQTLLTGLASANRRDGMKTVCGSNWGMQEVVAVDLACRSEVIVRVPAFVFSIDWRRSFRTSSWAGTIRQDCRRGRRE